MPFIKDGFENGDRAFHVVEFTAEDLHEMESATSQIKVQGDRYSEAAQRMINR